MESDQGAALKIPDAHLLFSGDFQRSGNDLIIADELHRVVVPDYFRGDKRPQLVSPEGARLDPAFIDAVTGHTLYAQAGAPAAAGKVVGHVAKMTGSASVVRNGVTVELNNGDTVYQNDVVQTGSGSTLGLVMVDGTTFNLTANARLMLNDLTYDAASTSNTSLFTLVQGAASFVAGQTAKSGDMKVATPVASIGIRGTAVILDISSTDGKVSISVVDQQDNQVHAVQVFNTRGDLIGTVTSNGSSLTLTPTATFEVIAEQSNKTPAQVAQEFNAFQQVINTYDAFKAIAPNTPPPTDGRRGDATPQSNTKFAQSIQPSYTAPSFNADVGVNTKVSQTASASEPTPATSPPTTGSTGQSTQPPASQDLFIPVQTAQASIPFVVTRPTVGLISVGSGNHFGPVMSADGRYVTYDPDGAIYLFDRQSGATSTIAAPAAGFTYGSPSISSDGRYVVYEGHSGANSYIFLYGTNPSDPAHYHQQTLIGPGSNPEISGNGSKIVAEHGGSDILIYNQQGQVVGSITPAALSVSGTLWKPAISADGNAIAFWSSNSSGAGGSGQLFTYNVSTGVVSAVASTAAGAGLAAASLSADGHLIAYQAQTPGGHSEIYLYDLTSGHVVFQTSNAAGSYNPVISPDGHFIIFASDARLTADDTNNYADTYVVDVTDPSHPTYKLVSALADGTQGNAASNLGATISAGGLYVAFGSSASNLSTGNASTGGNIFVVDPTSGHSAIIEESASSPNVLTASGSIAMTGGVNDVKLSVSDPTKLSAQFSADGSAILWTFSEAKSDFASLAYGQNATQLFNITLSFKGGTTTVPVVVTVHNAVQPSVAPVDFAPVANPVTLSPGQQNTSYVITQAALLSAVGDIDGPTLSITSVTVQSGGGKIVQNPDSTWTYTPDPSFSGQVVFNYTASDSIKTASSTASLKIVPPLAITAIAPDSGTPGDFITNSTSLTVSGSNGPLGAGEKIQVSSDNGITWTDAAVTGTTWSLADPATHGTSFTYQVRILDATSGVVNVATHAVVIDTAIGAPRAAFSGANSAVPGEVNAAHAAGASYTVSGVDSDAIATVAFSGVLKSTGLIGLLFGDGHNGSHSVDLSGFRDGTVAVTISAVDIAGNSIVGTGDTVTLDTAAPSVTTLTGVASNGNDLRAGQTMTFTLTASEALTVANGAALTLNNGATATYQSGSGTTSATFVYTVAAGQDTADLKVTGYSGAITDAAGNALAGGVTLDTGVKIDTTAPTGGTPALTAASDSGASSADNITNVTGPTFTVALNPTLAIGDTVQLLLNGSPLAHPVAHTVTAADLTAGSIGLTVTPGDLGADGLKSIAAKFTDSAGNSSTTSALSFTLDTTAPVVTIGNAGGNTNQSVQTITGTVDLNDVGATVIVLDGNSAVGAALVQGNGSWSANVTLNAGSNSLIAHVTDAAGNQGISNAVTYVLNTVGPTGGTPVLAPSSDSGVSSSDGVTNVQAPTFTVSLGATVVAGATVQLLLNGSPLAHPVVHTVTPADIVAGSVSLTVTAGDLGSDGSKSISAQLSDLFGNSNPTGALGITLDTTAPTGGRPALTAASDSGSSSTDNVTDVTNPTFTVALNPTAAVGDTVQLLLNGAPLAHNVAHTVTSADLSSGSVSLTVTAGDLGADGSKSITARLTDAAGNSSSTPADIITLDTTTPTGGTPALTASSDSGSSSTDNITAVTNPTFTVTLTPTTVAVGDTVQLLLNGSPLAHNVIHTITSTDISGGSVSLTVTAGDLGADGSKSITARFTDPAGNSSTTPADVITLDTTAPAVTSVTAPAGDFGPGRVIAFTVNFSEAVTVDTTGGAPKLALSNGATATYASGSGTNALVFNYTVGASGSGQDAVDLGTAAANALSLNGGTIRDAAGNAAALGGASNVNPAGILQIDTTVPIVSITTSGATTSQSVQTISGTSSDVGATVRLYDNGGAIPLATTVVQGDGTWSASVTLGPGTNSLTAQVTDGAGNIGTSNAVAFTLPGFSVQWTGPDGGNWSTGANWSTSNVPGATDDVLIGVPDNVVFAGGTSVIDRLYSAAGSRLTVGGGAFVVTGANASSLLGSLFVQDASVELAAVSGGINVGFGGTTGLLKLDSTVSSTSTAAVSATAQGAAVSITAAGAISSAAADAIDVNSAGGPISVAINGTVSGALNGISAIQNGLGDIAMTGSGMVQGLAGRGIFAEQNTTGIGNVLVNGSGTVVGNGRAFSAVVAQNLNAANNGNVTVSESGGTIVGGHDGIHALTNGNGSLTVNLGANTTVLGSYLYGIEATANGAGSIAITTDASSVVLSGSVGINAYNQAAVLPQSGGVTTSSIMVAAHGTINSGTMLTGSSTRPAGILAGYRGGATNTANPNVFGDVNIDNFANINAAGGDGIRGYNFGSGNVTVVDHAGTTINAKDVYGISASSNGSGRVFVTTAAGDVINSGASGIAAINQATSIAAAANSSVTVVANGTINSGVHLTPSGSQPQGISAGYFGANGTPNTNINGSVSVDNFANVNARAGWGINAYNWGNGSVSVVDEANTSVSGAQVGIAAASLSSGSGSGSVTIAVGPNATITAGALYGLGAVGPNATITAGALYGLAGINASANNASNILIGPTATMNSTLAATWNDVINSGGTGIQAGNQQTSAIATQISVTAAGTINSGFNMATNGNQPGGIWAGYNPGNLAQVNTGVHGNVIVDNWANINAPSGVGIGLFNFSAGSVAATIEAFSTVSAVTAGVNAFAQGGGAVTVVNQGSLTATFGPGITVGTSGTVSISNSGSVTSPGSGQAPVIQINNSASATFTNSGSVTSGLFARSASNLALADYNGGITVNNAGTITGNVSLASGIFNNQAAGVWRINGFNWLGSGAALNNTGNISLSGLSFLNAAAIFLLTNDGAIAVQPNSVGFINANVATDAGKSGTFLIGDRSGLELAGSVAAGQTISFRGTGGVLTLDNPSAFQGTIDGLTVGDTLTLHGGFVVSSASISGSTLTVTKADNTTLSYQVTNVQAGTTLNVLSGDKIVVVPGTAVTISGLISFSDNPSTSKSYIFANNTISGTGPGIGITSSDSNPADTIFVNINQTTSLSMSGGDAAVKLQTGGASIVLMNAGNVSSTTAPGIFAQLFAATPSAGSIDILDYGSVAGSTGIRALTSGAGLLNVVVGGGATITGSSSHGIFASSTLGAIDITTIGNVNITSSGIGILAQNQGTAVPQGALSGSNSSISISTGVGGTINAGGQGISAGYLTGTNTPAAIPNPPNTAVYGDVSIDDGANITAGTGSGIVAFNYGTGNVSVALEGGTTITAVAAGITIPGTTQSQYGISAFTYGAGNTTVTTGPSIGPSLFSITSGSTGLQVGNQAFAGTGTSVTVVSLGSIHSGANNNNNGTAPAGIQAGYNPGLASAFNPNVSGDVSVFVGGNIVADAGDGINAYNYAIGNIAVDVGFGVSIQAMNPATSSSGKAPYGIGAFNYGPGNINITMSSGDTINSHSSSNSGSSGINASHQATATPAGPVAPALVTVSSAGSIHSGSFNNNSGSLPSGITAGFLGGTSAAPNLAVHGNVIVNNAANITADAGYGINAYNYGQGDITVNQAAGTTISSVQEAIDAHAEADGASGNIAVNVYAGATLNSKSGYGILALSKDSGSISVITSGADVINSGGAGINAVNEATAISPAVNSSVVVTTAGNSTINSGAGLTGFGNQPAGILAGYIGGATNPGPANLANSSVFGETVVNNSANINAAAGDGIRAYNYGVGDITVNDLFGTITALGAAGNPPNGSGLGIGALNYGSGGVHVSTAGGTVINSGSSGIAAVNKATTVDSANASYVVPATSLVSVQASGTILSGTIPTATVATDPAAGILAGFNPNNTNTPNINIHGNVAVDSFATIINAETFNVALTPSVTAGSTIKLLLAGSPLAHPVTHVVTQADVGAGSVNLNVLPSDLAGAAAGALSAQFLNPSQAVIGSATPSLIGLAQTDGIRGVNYGTGEISITNEAGASISAIHDGIAALGFDGGNVVVTNSGSVVAGTAVHAMTTGTGTVSIDNSGYLGGAVNAYNATFTNELGGDWSINGTSQFTGTSTLTNLGRIESNGTSVIGGLSGLTNSGIIEVETGSLMIAAPVTGAGTALIFGATLEFAAASDTHIQFDTGPSTSGTLLLDDVAHFTGSVTGFSQGDTIDLAGIAPANVSVSSAGGLHVSYGTGSFALLGNYDPAGFSVVSDNHGGTDIVWTHQAPFIATDNLTTANNNVSGTTTVLGLQISDPGASSVTLGAATGAAASGTSISPAAISGSLASVNATLATGVTYNPGSTPPPIDKVMLTATDNFGAAESVNFVFYQSGNANVPLVGTSGNDVVFASGGSDVLTGGAGHDQFVFQPTGGSNTVQHTVTDFSPGIDTLDLRQFYPAISASAPPTAVQVGNDTLVTLDSHDTLLLKNVTAANLHASDFILHA